MNTYSELNPTEKRMPLRIVCFSLALLIAVGAFTFGIGYVVKKNPGWYEIKASASESMPADSSAFSLHYYLSGESDSIRQSKNELESAYTNALSRALKLLDADTLYDGYKNIAYINAHPGEDVTVSDELYTVLEDAVKKTEEGSAYSVFSGAEYGLWVSIAMLEDPIAFDPLTNGESAASLAALSLPVSLNEAAELIFTEEKNTVRLEVSAVYASLLNAYEAEEPILDLTVLRDAYVIRLVSDSLAERGYAGGYYESESGIILYRDEDTSGVFPLYTEKGGEALFAAYAEMKNPTSLCRWLSFPLTDGEYGFYTVTGEDGTVYHRSLYLARDAEPNTVLLGASAILYGDDPVEAAYAALKLYDAEDEAELKQAIRENGEEGILSVCTVSAEPECFCVSENAASFVKATEDGIRIRIIE